VRSLVHAHYLVHGRVQGVNYRARVREAALRHGLAGRVSNRPDGTVLIDVQGAFEAVEEFLKDVSRPRGDSHPRLLQRIAELPVSHELTTFEILRD
jgi:acylphosphatase